MFTWLKNMLGMGEASGVRARNAKGHYVADDKSTPNVNEAYVDGKKPKRKTKPAAKKPVAKKAPAKKGRPRKNRK
mgnify:CR=1 FL=1|tara:strand:+ start:19858 stop:20082 length:225 start_codon:yes stop_codon:yes gene_type:complete